MPEKTKPDKDFEKPEVAEIAESRNGQSEDNGKDTWSADQREKSYYYDDDYGYEVYDPDEPDEQ